MVILITGASHIGKTALAQRLLERYHYPYLSIDHLKMGLIRSGQTALTPEDDALLTDYLWTIIREIVKTAVENEQNLTIEGCYIPAGWHRDFEQLYLDRIRYYCLVMSEDYISRHFSDIQRYANVAEKRLDEALDPQALIRDNAAYLEACRQHGYRCILIDDEYHADILL